jgi:hypothetical protein
MDHRSRPNDPRKLKTSAIGSLVESDNRSIAYAEYEGNIQL